MLGSLASQPDLPVPGMLEVLADPRHSAGGSGVRVQACGETRALTH